MDARASFSNYGSWVSIAALGALIHSTLMGGGYGDKQGTSMAAPYVAGVAGLMRAIRPDWSVQKIRGALENYGDPVTGFSGNSSIRRLNAFKSLQADPSDASPLVKAVKGLVTNYAATLKWNVNEPVTTQLTYATTSYLSGGITVAGTESSTTP